MYREVIRSTPWWSQGDIAGPRRDCVFVDGGSGAPGMRGLLVGHVHLFFSFSFANTDHPCALVHWYAKLGDKPDEPTGLWVVEPEYIHGC